MIETFYLGKNTMPCTTESTVGCGKARNWGVTLKTSSPNDGQAQYPYYIQI